MFMKIWNASKYVKDTLKGAVVVLASPNMKIPPTKLDPRMPSRPRTMFEFIRMFAWRYNWKYMPFFRFWVFSALITLGIYEFLLPIKPHHIAIHKEINHKIHHLERGHLYGRTQRQHDKKYFEEVDPFRPTRNH